MEYCCFFPPHIQNNAFNEFNHINPYSYYTFTLKSRAEHTMQYITTVGFFFFKTTELMYFKCREKAMVSDIFSILNHLKSISAEFFKLALLLLNHKCIICYVIKPTQVCNKKKSRKVFLFSFVKIRF